MRRSDRLAEIADIVRDGRLHRAADLAERFAVSLRTIYRDIDTLVDSGFPIEGERGVGYLLRERVRLPSLHLSSAELEALHLGMAIVAEAADPELADAASTLIEKIGRVAPPGRSLPSRWGFEVYPFDRARAGFAHMPLLRAAIRSREKLRLAYRSADDAPSRRTVRPLQLEYWGRVWTLTAWCELRGDFRTFRTDRIERCDATGEGFEEEPGKRLEDFLCALTECGDPPDVGG